MQIKEIITPDGTHYIEFLFDTEADWLMFKHKCGQVYLIQMVNEKKPF